MRDQAAELRSLVLRSLRQSTADMGPQPRLIAVTGGKGGVGATTLAVNVAVSLAEQALRVVLVDGNLSRADVGLLCGVDSESSVQDVLMGRRDIHEVLRLGPAGIQVAPGVWSRDRVERIPDTALLRLVRQLNMLGRHADVVIVDTGSGTGEAIREFWEAASEVLLVTTPDSVSVMDAYATIKLLASGDGMPALRIVVNRCPTAEAGEDVFQRIAQSCQRFLQVSVAAHAFVPVAPETTAAASEGVPLVIHNPACPASRQIHQLAGSIANVRPAASYKKAAA